MSATTTTQRGSYYVRTLHQTLAAEGDVTDPIAAPSATVQIAGSGSTTVQVLRHPATEEWLNAAPAAPDVDSPLWADVAPDDPLTGDLSDGPVVADYRGSGFGWWAVKLTDGADVEVFISVDGQ